MHLTTRTRVFPGMALAVIAGLALTSCAATSDAEPEGEQPSSGTGSIEAVQAAVDLLPEAIAESGVLRVAIPTNEPPTQFYREGTEEMTGLNPDMARLVADALGLEIEVVVSNFDSIIPGLAADRFDMTVSSMTPTEVRMEQLDFVDYVNMGSAVVVAEGNPADIDVNALCGARVAVLTGSYQLTVKIPALNEACAESGGEPLDIQQFKDTRQAISSLDSGRSDAVYADGPILSYAALQNPDIEIAGELDVSPVGIGVPKASGLIDAVAAAMDAIIESPGYMEVLEAYGLEAMAIDEARVNFAQ